MFTSKCTSKQLHTHQLQAHHVLEHSLHFTRQLFSQLVSWCFEPSQPQGIMSQLILENNKEKSRPWKLNNRTAYT